MNGFDEIRPVARVTLDAALDAGWVLLGCGTHAAFSLRYDRRRDAAIWPDGRVSVGPHGFGAWRMLSAPPRTPDGWRTLAETTDFHG